MATTENRGGANGGPQYNPMNVKANGGNGQAGGRAAKATAKAQQLRPSGGGARGATQALTQQIRQGGNVRTTAPATVSKVPRATGIPMGMRGAPVTPITAPSENVDESIFAGTELPGGAGPEALMLPPSAEGDARFNNSIQSYAQVLQYVASQPNVSQETRNVIAMLLRQTEV